MKLAGDLAEFSLPDLLQVQGAAGRSTALKLLGPEGAGVVYLRSGRVMHAQYANLEGEAAFYALVALKSGYFEEAEVPGGVPTTLGMPVSDLLLRAYELAERGGLPRPRRVESGRADFAAAEAASPPVAPTIAAAPTVLGSRDAPAPLSASAGAASAPVARAASSRAEEPRSRKLLWGIAAFVAIALGVVGAETLRPSNPGGESVAPKSAAPAAIVEASELTGGGDRAPELVQGEKPAAPVSDLALLPTIVCRIRIDETGKVAESKVYRSRVELEAFEEAALRAVESYRFRPAEQAGKPVSVWINWPVDFR